MDVQTEADKEAIINKIFDCAEAPIKEWIAGYIDEDPSFVFNEYNDESDVIGFQENDKHYNTYLVTLDNDTSSNVDSELLKSSEKTRKACSMLFDGVYQVFASVLQVVSEEFFDKVKLLRPVFDETTMSFKLVAINCAAAQLQAALEQKTKIVKHLSGLTEPLTAETQANIDKSIGKLNEIIASNTKEILDAEEEKCILTNQKLVNYDKLFIVVEESSEDDVDTLDKSLKRLPVFGLTYQDPDEDNYIDKLKKEYQVND